MAYDYDRLFEYIVAAVSAEGPIAGRMRRLIASCEDQRPHPGWRALRQIDFTADEAKLGPWLTRAGAEAGAGAAYRGLWFGLNNPVVDGETSADIYLAASPAFESDSIDWAVDCTFYPEDRALNSVVLDGIYRHAYDTPGGLGNDAEYPLALAYGAMAACAALEAAALPAAFHELQGAAAGFDSGDFLFLGGFAEGRFQRSVTAG